MTMIRKTKVSRTNILEIAKTHYHKNFNAFITLNSSTRKLTDQMTKTM